jgi:hypothetical protein
MESTSGAELAYTTFIAVKRRLEMENVVCLERRNSVRVNEELSKATKHL